MGFKMRKKEEGLTTGFIVHNYYDYYYYYYYYYFALWQVHVLRRHIGMLTKFLQKKKLKISKK